ncbi:hypothetical protein ACFL0O_01055 [Thermodesulfobacteriota bacterium]
MGALVGVEYLGLSIPPEGIVKGVATKIGIKSKEYWTGARIKPFGRAIP